MIVPLHIGGPHAQGPVAAGAAIAWTEDGSAYIARNGTTQRVAAGEAIGIDGKYVVVLRAGRLTIGARERRVDATDGRWGSGHLLTVHLDPDGRVSVVVDGRTIEHVRGDNPHVYPGQINARYAVWTAGGAGRYRVERYDLQTRRVLRIPGDAPARPQYGAAVDSKGSVYFARSGFACGGGTLFRWRAGVTTKLATLKRSEDYGSAWFAGASVYFDLGDCAGRSQRLVRLRVG